MIVGLVKRLPGRWLFLVHRDNLVSQQARRYKKYTGLMANEMSRTPPKDWRLVCGLNLMTLQSLAAGLRADRAGVKAALGQLDGLVVDECHVAPADVYYNAIQQCSAEYRFGFSGTPLDRGDNRSLMAIACLGKVVYSIKPQVLIDAGYLAAPQITMVPVKQTVSAEAKAEGFHGVYDELICESEERNAAIVEIVRTAPKPCMVFVRIVDHGRQLTHAMRAEGINTEFIWGEKSKRAREDAVERLERGDSEVLVASVVFQEGVDIPGLASVVVASGGKSIIAALQRVGRGMRTNNGKKATFDVYDVLDLGSPMMEKHSRRRMNTYVREAYTTVIRSADGSIAAYQPKLKTRREKREQQIK
jgi:superfamily II DNA or RNA helicase